MSDVPPEDPPEDDVLAGEHALGVLDLSARIAAEARMLRDPVFARKVEAWRSRLAPLAGEIPSVPPSAGLWPRIEAALADNDNGRRSLRLWRGATAGALALAAASLVIAVSLANRPPTYIVSPPLAAAPVLNAKLDAKTGQHLFVAAYDPDRRALLVTSLVPAGADPAHVHQLWLIPADGKPRSLGMVAPGSSATLPVAAPLAALAIEGATVAVSVEPPGGSKLEGPSGPVAALGKLAKI